VVSHNLGAIKIFPNFTEPSLSHSPDAETDRNYISNYSLYNSQGGMTVHLLELQPLMVLLSIPKITDEAIWIMGRMVINRGNFNKSEKNVSLLPICLQHIQHGLPSDRSQTSIVTAHDLVHELNSY